MFTYLAMILIHVILIVSKSLDFELNPLLTVLHCQIEHQSILIYELVQQSMILQMLLMILNFQNNINMTLLVVKLLGILLLALKTLQLELLILVLFIIIRILKIIFGLIQEKVERMLMVAIREPMALTMMIMVTQMIIEVGILRAMIMMLLMIMGMELIAQAQSVLPVIMGLVLLALTGM